jgi:nicotinamide-nucleotide amidase
MFDPALIARATRLLETCRSKSIRIVSAESCTGGLVAALLTEIPGSSDVFERGFVTYSNASKTQLLGVSEAIIDAWAP